MVTAERPPKQHDRLTPRQRLFVNAVAQGKPHAEAATIAGYTGDTPRKLAERALKQDKVREAISRARSSYDDVQQMSLDWWRTWLLQLRRKADAAQDIPSEIRIAELAGRHLGALDPQQPLHPSAQALMDALTQAMQQRSLPINTHTHAGAHAREGVIIEARVTDETGASGAGDTGTPPGTS